MMENNLKHHFFIHYDKLIQNIRFKDVYQVNQVKQVEPVEQVDQVNHVKQFTDGETVIS